MTVIIQQVQATSATQISNPVNPIALTAKSSPINGKKLNIAPTYHKITNPKIIEIAVLIMSFFITVSPIDSVLSSSSSPPNVHVCDCIVTYGYMFCNRQMKAAGMLCGGETGRGAEKSPLQNDARFDILSLEKSISG